LTTANRKIKEEARKKRGMRIKWKMIAEGRKLDVAVEETTKTRAMIMTRKRTGMRTVEREESRK
jgi:hypothetical protein